ncbi:MAG: hypothetical protein JOZ33_04430 [Acidobacteriaceae bacterium]|nr:hypothetical protein [Acidobacteriaceae bacterium]
MSSPAEQNNRIENAEPPAQNNKAADQAESIPPPQDWAVGPPEAAYAWQETESETPDAPTAIPSPAADSVQEAFEQARTQAAQICQRVFGRVQHLAGSARARAMQAKQEQPLQFLAILAGAGFVAGVAIRIWRSRRS